MPRALAVAAVALLAGGCLDHRAESMPASPAVTEAQVAGVWVDGHGGVLELDAGHQARATRIPCEDHASVTHSGRGEWSLRDYRPGPNGRVVGGDVVVAVTAGCAQMYGIAGTAEGFHLYYYVGDLDTREAYVLERK